MLDIWAYIAADSPDNADTFLDVIDKKIVLLAATHRMGRERREIGKSIRSFPVGNYVIFYRPIKDGIEIVRVLHGARDIPSLDF